MKSFIRATCIISLLVHQSIYAKEAVIESFSPPILTAAGFTVEKDFNHNRPILLESLDAGETWTKPLSLFNNLPASGVFEKTSCTGNGDNTVCIAVGSQDEYKAIPLLAVKSSGHNDWYVKYLKSHGSLFGASCTGFGITSTCAVGLQDFSTPPFVVTSRDGGNHWYKKTIEGLTTGADIELTAMSCTGSDSETMCAAIGAETLFDNREFIGFKPIVVVGVKNHWITKPVSSLNNNLLLSDVSCTGNGSTAICVAIGSEDHDYPGMIVSQDGGETWTKKEIEGLPKASEIKHISCTGEGKNAVCAAIGGTLVNPMGKYAPLIVVTANGGDTWSSKLVDSSEDDTDYSKELLSIHCTGEGHLAICVAAGFKELLDTNSAATSIGMIIVSSDGGDSWKARSVDALPLEDSFFSGAICTNNDLTTMCSAVGAANGRPMIATSNDNGIHWGVSRSLFDLQLRNGVLLDISATNNNHIN